MAAIGMYGVLSQLVTERRREVGVGMALGASPGDVVGLVVRRSLFFTGAGIVAGAVNSVLRMRLAAQAAFSPVRAVRCCCWQSPR